jgi:hypothetical protein
MQKIFIIFALFFTHFFQINAQKDKLDQLFEQYQETQGVTSIKIAKPMFGMLNKLNINDAELDKIKPLLSKINGLKIMIIEENPEDSGSDKPASFYKNLSKEILNSVNQLNYEELMTVNSKGNKMKFLSADATNGILNNLLLNISSEGNTILMMLDGKISMNDVNKLIEEAYNFDPVGENFDPMGEGEDPHSNNESEYSETTSVTNSETISVTNSDTNISSNKQERTVGKFGGIAISSGIKVNFTQGNNQSVVVDTDPNMQQYVTTAVKNNILYINVNNRGKKNLNFKKLIVNVEAPQLSSAKISSGSVLSTMNTVNENDFDAEISSGAIFNGNLKIKNHARVIITSGSVAKIDVNAKIFEHYGNSGSVSTVTGNVQNAVFDLSSASNCNAQDLQTNTMNADVSSGANLKIHVKDSLTADASSGASIRYRGNPSKNSVKESSGGSIKPIN